MKRLDWLDVLCLLGGSGLLVFAWHSWRYPQPRVLRDVVAGREVMRLALTNGSVTLSPTWPGLARLDTYYGSYFVGLRTNILWVTNRDE